MLVLASASPRRRELLAQAGFTFGIEPASISEDLRPDENAFAYVTRVAREKGEFVYSRLAGQNGEGLIVLGADTSVVAPTGEILAKPENEADAKRMLRLLAGGTHQVMTGVALVSAQGTETAVEVTHVSMVTLSDAEIAAYVATGEPMDKAGGYGIQGYAGRWIPRIQGCYFNVMGLPLALVSAMVEGLLKRGERAALASISSK